MTIKQSPDFVKKLRRLTKKNSSLSKKIDLKLKIMTFDKSHNSLRLHKIRAASVEMWSISVDMSLRIMFVFREYGILLVDIGSHDEVY